MNESLKTLRTKSMHLYFNYRTGLITQEEYQRYIEPLDDAIDGLELQALNCLLQDSPACEISSLKHLR